MTIKNKFKIAFKNLREHKLRSLLTLVSIAVGIATLTSLIIISQSMERAVGERLGGTVDVIRVLPGHVVPGRDFVPYGSFTVESAAIVQAIYGVQEVSTWLVEIAVAEYNGNFAPVEIMGGEITDIQVFLGESIALTEGRMVEAENEVILSTSTVSHINRWLGTDGVNADFRINDTLTINGVDTTIVGIMAYDLAGVEVSHRVIMSTNLARKIVDTDDIMLMLVRIADLGKALEIKDEIENALDEYFGVTGLTSAIAAETIIDAVTMVTRIVQAVVISIAVIALIVGCMGIINVMLMAVLERTREIGIMKAVGAKSRDISTLFLIEAGITGLLGGILGVIFGVSVSLFANTVMSRFVLTNIELVISPWVLILGIATAVVTGIIGGLYPAKRAAKMKPVEALRHEN